MLLALAAAVHRKARKSVVYNVKWLSGLLRSAYSSSSSKVLCKSLNRALYNSAPNLHLFVNFYDPNSGKFWQTLSEKLHLTESPIMVIGLYIATLNSCENHPHSLLFKLILKTSKKKRLASQNFQFVFENTLA